MIVLPDVESIVVAYLKAESAVNAIVSGRVSGDLPVKPTFPALTVLLIDDIPPIEWWLSGAAIQVDSFAEKREDARTLARTAFAAMIAMRGVQGSLGVVTGVASLLGVRRMPEPVDNRARYMFEVRVFAHPVS